MPIFLHVQFIRASIFSSPTLASSLNSHYEPTRTFQLEPCLLTPSVSEQLFISKDTLFQVLNGLSIKFSYFGLLPHLTINLTSIPEKAVGLEASTLIFGKLLRFFFFSIF